MGLPTPDIIAAAVARYRANTDLRALLVGSTAPTWNVFDAMGVPTNTLSPYITVFPVDSSSGTALAMGTDAVDTFLLVSGFTQTGASGGFAQVRGIMKVIYSITHKQPFDLSASGFNQFFLLFDNEQEKEQEDGITQMIAHRYKLMTTG